MSDISNEIFKKSTLINSKLLDTEEKTDKKGIIIFRQSRVLLISKILSIALLTTLTFVFIRIPFLLDVFDLPQETKLSLLPIFFTVFITLHIVNAYLLVIVVMGWLNTFYRIKGAKIEYVSGILTKKVKTFSLEHTQEVSCSQSLIGLMFNFGSVEVYNPGLKTKVKLSGVSNPQKICDYIQEHCVTDKITYQA